MTRLVDPHIRYHRSYLVASDEFAMSGDSRDGDGVGREDADDSYAGFEFTRKGLEVDRGGHIGYSVRPSARRQGHATAALRQSLGVARDAIGLDRVLVTCRDDNAASRAVIEACGGVYEDARDHTRRYWITTRSPAGLPLRRSPTRG